MSSFIRDMSIEDRESVIDMMRVFYTSQAVLTNGSEEIFSSDVENCTNDNPYLEGYIIEHGETKEIQGYVMVAKSFSTEFGKPCMWIEDLYIKENYRSMGLGTKALNFICEKYPDALIRLEVEKENEKAVAVYKKCGFEELPYMEMKK